MNSLLFCPKGFSLQEARAATHSLTLKGNGGVSQIKQSYPAASVSACAL